ncbi:MAG: hypothetical protein FWC24_06335 [Treponema sp.]|nr:hypothetical protein [Treponema sp.]
MFKTLLMGRYGNMVMTRILLLIFLLFPFHLEAETFRTIIQGNIEVSPGNQAGSSVTLGINGSALINLGADRRFLRGIEIEVSAPQAWISYRGSLLMMMYNKLNIQGGGASVEVSRGAVDLEGSRIAYEPLPGKLQIVYQIPLRQGHGLRTTSYITVPAGVTSTDTFPVLFRLMTVAKGATDEFERMTFNLTARPVLSDEGAVRLVPRYPPQLRGKPFTVLIDDVLISNIADELILKEGEHHLVILSDDYRNESRRFIVERAKTLDLAIELQDPTPLIIFEGPGNAVIFLDNVPVLQNGQPISVEPGQREIKYQIGDYTVIKTLNIQRGKTYRVALDVDLAFHEDN